MKSATTRCLRSFLKGALLPLFSFVVTLSLGVTGYIKFNGNGALNFDIVQRSFYDTIQLFILEYDFDSGHNVFIQIARWSGALILIWGAVKLYFYFFRQILVYTRIALWRNHIIFYGLSGYGSYTLHSFLADKPRAKIVCIDPDNILQEKLGSRRVLHLTGHDSSAALLRRAGAGHAKILIANSGDDITNIQILRSACDFSANRKTGQLCAYAHIGNTKLLTELNDLDVITKTLPNFDGRIYNGFFNAARIVANQHAPDVFAPVRYQEDNLYEKANIHCLIIGFNDYAEALTVQLIRIGQFINLLKIKLTIIDRHADSKKRDFLNRHPDLPIVADIEFIQHNPACLNIARVHSIPSFESISTVYMCQHDMPDQILSHRALNQALSSAVNYIISHNDDLPTLSGFEESANVLTINPFIQAFDKKVIIDEALESLAKAFHNRYLIREEKNFTDKVKKFQLALERGEVTQADEPKPKPSMVPWHSLPEEYKFSNRSLAEHIPVKLRAIGCEVAPHDETRAKIDFTDDEKLVNQLAIIEHNRWMADRILSGWTYGDPRDDSKKIHDKLVEWYKLDADTQQYDIEAIKEIPEVLAEYDLKVCLSSEQDKVQKNKKPR